MLKPIDRELEDKLNKVNFDDDLHNLGFRCQGMLCEYKGYQNFYERLWVWTKKVDNSEDIHTVVAFDEGNSWCNIAYRDMYIEELCS